MKNKDNLMTSNPWVTYNNGNYRVFLNTETGTKIRTNNLDSLIPTHPESMDVKITNSCNMMCKQCHEASTPNGKHGDILNAKFLETLLPYTELAIGGGNPLAHPDLEEFLYKCKDLKLIPSMTVHQKHFLENVELLKHYKNEGLIYGLGVSVVSVTEELIKTLKEFPTAVCHIIAGIADENIITKLAHNDLKVLILGYKQFRRGKDLYEIEEDNIRFLIQFLYDALPEIIKDEWFNTVCFDNLAIKQLNVKRLMSEEEWQEFYMGDDGTHTFYIDLVNQRYALSSTAEETFPLEDDVTTMFQHIRKIHDSMEAPI